MKMSKWWKNHWDEVALVVLVGGGLLLMIFSLGVLN